MPSSSPPPGSSPSSSDQKDVNLPSITGNAPLTIKGVFSNPAMVFPTLDRDGTYRVRGFAMETIFQRVRVTEINFHEYSWNSRGNASEVSDKEMEETQRLTEMERANPVDHPESVTVVCEVDVLPDMANNRYTMHGGCTAFLVDMCSSLALAALTRNINPNSSKFKAVSQSLNIVYHSPAPVGDRLRIVSTTMPVPFVSKELELDSNVCVQTEIWSKDYHRLVASGMHNMMPVSESPSIKSHL